MYERKAESLSNSFRESGYTTWAKYEPGKIYSLGIPLGSPNLVSSSSERERISLLNSGKAAEGDDEAADSSGAGELASCSG